MTRRWIIVAVALLAACGKDAPGSDKAGPDAKKPPATKAELTLEEVIAALKDEALVKAYSGKPIVIKDVYLNEVSSGSLLLGTPTDQRITCVADGGVPPKYAALRDKVASEVAAVKKFGHMGQWTEPTHTVRGTVATMTGGESLFAVVSCSLD